MSVLRFLLQILATILVVRLLGSMLGLFGGGKRRDKKAAGPPAEHDYRNLTPYEIDDADFEEIPGRKK